MGDNNDGVRRASDFVDATLVSFDRELDDLHIAIDELALAVASADPARIEFATAHIDRACRLVEASLVAVEARTSAMVRDEMLAHVRLHVARDALRAVLAAAARTPSTSPLVLVALDRLAAIAASDQAGSGAGGSGDPPRPPGRNRVSCSHLGRWRRR